MNFFDFATISYVNQFSQHSWLFDKTIGFLSQNGLVKGGVLTTIIWWAWFKREDRHSHNREHIISTLFGGVIAIALARALAVTLPFRLRPLHEEVLHFLLPFGMAPQRLEGWSSFPSDHAVLFFTLATGLVFILRKVGIFALFYSILFICFPRLYLGLHYPTDIIAGAAIGITIALIVNIYLVRRKLYNQSSTYRLLNLIFFTRYFFSSLTRLPICLLAVGLWLMECLNSFSVLLPDNHIQQTPLRCTAVVLCSMIIILSINL